MCLWFFCCLSFLLPVCWSSWWVVGMQLLTVFGAWVTAHKHTLSIYSVKSRRFMDILREQDDTPFFLMQAANRVHIPENVFHTFWVWALDLYGLPTWLHVGTLHRKIIYCSSRLDLHLMEQIQITQRVISEMLCWDAMFRNELIV